jgi:predicted nuclease of predicted toxin-antitoxin system
MRFKLDENLPLAVLAVFEAGGHNADTAAAEGLAGTDDATLLAGAMREQRALVTLDLDFSDFRRYPPEQANGIVVLRPSDQSVVQVLAVVRAVLRVLEDEPLAGKLWIADPSRVRIRP